MKIFRKREMAITSVSDYRVGDQIQVGKYTATCQKVTDSTAVFLLDQYLDNDCRMNMEWANEGGYEASTLRATIGGSDFVESDKNFATVREHLVAFDNGDLLRIPTVGEMFGDVGFYEMDDAERWKLMKDRSNRIADREGCVYECGWLQNRVHNSVTDFAYVNHMGNVSYGGPCACHGVRPVFQLAD